MHALRPLLCCAVIAGVLLLPSCSRHEPVAAPAGNDARVFTVRGVVRGPYAEGSVAIQHEAIPNYMPAMTMPFNVDASEGQALVVGDRVEFEFHVTGERSRATRFRKVGTAAALEASETPRPAMARLRAGDVVPGFALVDQEGRPFASEALRGRRTILTFIFTRCPVPEFCPLLAQKFQALQTALHEQAPLQDVQLLSITIDPGHDRPAILREYGQALKADFARWKFLTGAPAAIEELTRRFAVRTARNGAALDHTLATALIGSDGRVVEIWRGNAWKPEEVLAALQERAAVVK